MNTSLRNRIASIAKRPKNFSDKVELEEQILSARFLSEIQKYLDSNKMSKKDFAKQIGVSASFVSQLFTGDKIASLNFIARVQLKLDIKFYVSTIDQHEIESVIDKAVDDIFKRILEIEKHKYNSKREIEEGLWVIHSKDKPDYSEMKIEVPQTNHLSIAS
jgi:transcriptional regulator with XRE-family HTH domain